MNVAERYTMPPHTQIAPSTYRLVVSESHDVDLSGNGRYTLPYLRSDVVKLDEVSAVRTRFVDVTDDPTGVCPASEHINVGIAPNDFKAAVVGEICLGE